MNCISGNCTISYENLVHFWGFWLIWFINQRALYNHALSIIHHRHWHQCWHHHLCTFPPGTGLDKETSYLVYICTYVPHICTSNIKWFQLVVFKWQSFWYFSLICHPAHIDSHRDFILHILMYLLFTYIHTRNNATVTFFSEIYKHFLKNHWLFTCQRHVFWYEGNDMSCVFLANYVPKCQMSSGPYGPIFKYALYTSSRVLQLNWLYCHEILYLSSFLKLFQSQS